MIKSSPLCLLLHMSFPPVPPPTPFPPSVLAAPAITITQSTQAWVNSRALSWSVIASLCIQLHRHQSSVTVPNSAPSNTTSSSLGPSHALVAPRLWPFSQSRPVLSSPAPTGYLRCKTPNISSRYSIHLYSLLPLPQTCHPPSRCICDQPGNASRQRRIYFKVTPNIIIQQIWLFFHLTQI